MQRISVWLQAGQPPLFLLGGGPGSGKTTLAARLVQTANGRGWRAKLCRPFPLPPPWCPVGWRLPIFAAFNDESLNPLNFVRNLSLSLAGLYPPFAEALLQNSDPAITITSMQSQFQAESGAVVQGIVIKSWSSAASPPRRRSRSSCASRWAPALPAAARLANRDPGRFAG